MLRSLCLFISCCCCCSIFLAPTKGQTILDAGNQPLADKWCDVDSNYQIVGQPGGGTFSGCGVFQQNGNWYFNPSIAVTGVTVFPSQCQLTYTTTTGSVTQNMLVYKPVVPNAGEDRVVCDGDTFTLSVTTLYAGAYTYNWMPATNLFSPTQQQTKGTITQTATYVITAKDVTSGCMGSDTITLFNKQPHPQMMLSTDTICANQPLMLSVPNPEANTRYTWQYEMDGRDSGTMVSHTYVSGGNYTIVLSAQNDYCTGAISKPVTVEDFKPELTAGVTSADRNQGIDLNVSSGVSFSVLAWTPAALFQNQTSTTQHVIADTSKTYTVIAQSVHGCIDTASLFLPVNPVLFVPSAFTPNGDGLNDYFRFSKWGESVSVQYFAVFDRWGKCVWEEQGNEAEHGWDGTFHGAPAEMGTYFYVLKLGTRFAHTVEQKGNVTLIR